VGLMVHPLHRLDQYSGILFQYLLLHKVNRGTVNLIYEILSVCSLVLGRSLDKYVFSNPLKVNGLWFAGESFKSPWSRFLSVPWFFLVLIVTSS
jgi:hypothetical protein